MDGIAHPRARRLTQKWKIISLVAPILFVLLFATCITEQKRKILVSNVSEFVVDQSHLFIASNDSSSGGAVDSLDPDSNYPVGSDADQIVEHLASPQNSSIHIKIPRVPMRITLTFPDNKAMKIFQGLKVVIICLFGILLFCMASVIFIMLGRFKPLKLQEAISRNKEAERKSMNDSMAFAQTSHDMHHALDSIIALIDFSEKKNNPNSDLQINLTKMKDYAEELQVLLNTILGTSKVDSRKMHLEQAEFNIADTIEESVDACNTLAEKKGLEMIWDPCDFSIFRLGSVIGDKQRFKRILGNLLSNAVKFTSEGEIVVRARASRPKVELLQFSSHYGCFVSHMFSCISGSILRYFDGKIKQQDVHDMQKDLNLIELTFEVHYTGQGIPVEKRQAVSQNYIQVKEDFPEGIIGLGLGIAQSYVRLMGGEISIQDKEPGEKGTCFKFNIFLKSGELPFQDTSKHGGATRSTVGSIHSLLFVQGCRTKRILQKWIDGLGIKVWTADQAEHISPTLEKIKKTVHSAEPGSVLLSKPNIGFLRDKEKASESLPIAQLYSEFPFRLLIIVDVSNGNFIEISSNLIEFYNGSSNLCYKIICIADSTVTEMQLCEFKAVVPCDLTLRKPIHGSRLKELYKLIQKLQTRKKLYVDRVAASPSAKPQTGKQAENNPCEIIEQTSSEVKEEKILRGKRVLLVDDGDIMTRLLGSNLLLKLGAEVEVAEDGFKALNLVKKALERGPTTTRAKCGDYSLAYDAVFMDCQMSEMDGYETAKQIRKEEEQYGIHVPIIALSVDKSDKDVKKAIAAGMDHVLEKPLSKFKLADLFKPTGY